MSFESIMEFLKDNEAAFLWSLTALFILGLIVLIVVAFKSEKKIENRHNKVKKLTAISMLAALSVVLYYFVKFPISFLLPFIPNFLDIQFSNVPIYIGGYMFGPIAGTIIAVIRFVVKLPGSSTLGVGELADLLIGLVTVLVSSMMYQRNKTKKTAIKASIWIVVLWVVVGTIANWLIILPFYIYMYTFEGVFGMLQVIPGITADNYMLYYLFIAIIPFNLILATLVSGITFLLYKRLSIIYEKA